MEEEDLSDTTYSLVISTPSPPSKTRKDPSTCTHCKRKLRLLLDEGFLLLSISQIVAFFLIAFLVGALIPMIVFKARDQSQVLIMTRTNMPRPSPLSPTQMPNHLRNTANSTSNATHSGVKLAWCKFNLVDHVFIMEESFESFQATST